MFAGSWRTTRALESFRELVKVVDQLTEEEVYFCLRLEHESQRRQTLIDKLIAKAAQFNQQHFVASLKEKLNGKAEISNFIPR